MGKRASAIAFMLGLSFFGALFALAVLGERTTLGFRAPALSPLSPGTDAPPVEVAGPPPGPSGPAAPQQPEPFEPVPILVPPTPRPEAPADEPEQADEVAPPEAAPSEPPPPAPVSSVDERQPKAPTATKKLAAEKPATEEPAVEEPVTEDDGDGGPAYRKGKTHKSTKKDDPRGTKGKGGTKKEKSVHATGEEPGQVSDKGKPEEPKPAKEKP